MRVLQVSSARHFGGGERHFVDLCRGLSGLGHEVFVALRPTNEWQKRLDFIPPERVFHVSIRNSFGILSANKIGNFARDNAIDIVHAHVARDYIPASIACMLANGPRFVLTRHLVLPLKPFNRFALKNLSRAIAVSSGVESSLKRVFSPDKITIIHNGIATADWSGSNRETLGNEFRFAHSIPFDAPLIGTVGELVALKGQRDFVLAANEIAKRFANAHFVIVGKDNTVDKKFRRELKRLVKVFRLDDRFLWLDWVEDTRELLSALDVFVSPSHSESFGLAILEAIAWGTPVVATQTSGAAEQLGGDAELVPIKDPVKLSEAVIRNLEDPAASRSTAGELQTAVHKRFSLDRMVEQTDSLYKEILQKTESTAGGKA